MTPCRSFAADPRLQVRRPSGSRVRPTSTRSPPTDTTSRLRAYRVHFTPGARTAWHTHPNGQVIHVTEGLGLAQRRGGAVEQIRAGDSVRFEPGEEHWHGAAPMHFMSHLALHEADEDGVDASWGEHVTDAEYNATPAEKP